MRFGNRCIQFLVTFYTAFSNILPVTFIYGNEDSFYLLMFFSLLSYFGIKYRYDFC